jgi:LuxR family maltose regulon positive regulatory protein
LFAKLAAKPTVAVIGAAGYGKSALIASWVAQSRPGGAVAWLTLDRSDCDPGRLAADLLAALQSPAKGRLGESLFSFEPPPAFVDPLTFVDALHEALLDTEVPQILVLDDVQEISRSQTALEMIDRMMLWMPPRIKIVIVSRALPRLRLQRLRLADRLELVSHKDLAFTLSETAEAARAWGLEIDEAAIEGIHELTHGWPAGIRMATLALSAGMSTDLSQALRQDDALADYLATEVLAALEPEVRDFVLKATIDDCVCPSLVDAVRGSTDSAAMLERCVRMGLFLTREQGATDEPWFRWHALFATHMRARRRETSVRSEELERRAASWWRSIDAGMAVTHALAGHDVALAGDIASSSWLDLVLSGRAETASRIVEESLAGASGTAELHLARAFVAAERGAIDAASVELNNARRASSPLQADARLRFEIRYTMIELFVVRDRAALAESVMHGRKLMAEVQSAPWPLDRATLALMQLCLGIGEARLLDRPLEALRLLRAARSTAMDFGYTALKLTAEAELCVPSVATGHLEETRQLAEATLTQARAKGWAELPSVAPAYGWLGWLALWKGHSRRARALLERCMDNLLPNDWGMLGLATTTHAQACISCGDIEAAETDVRRGRELASQGRMPPWWPSLLTSLEATVLVARGRVDEARRLAEKPTAGPQYHLATCYRANVLLRGGLPDAALATLQDVPPERMYPHVASAVEAHRAQALSELGDSDSAHAALERALADAEKYDFLEPFFMIGERISSLLQAHLSVGTAYPKFVMRVRNGLRRPNSATVNEWGETLTVREQNILRYLATNLTLLQVAEAEFITVNTVKTHIAHIYGKLGAKNRQEAVRLAADLRVL